jgi:IclR family KDG regulon transcriptional repressor
MAICLPPGEHPPLDVTLSPSAFPPSENLRSSVDALTKPKSDYSIQTVGNALRLLETFHEVDELGVSELSRRLSLHKNNVFRLLATLEQHGYIDQSPETEEYRLGGRCLDLGRSYARSHPLLRCSGPALESLSESVKESAHLAVLRDHEVAHIDGRQPVQLVLTASRIGRRLPAHSTALGKVLLGCAEQGVREDYDRDHVGSTGLAQHTDDTITDSHKLFEHLRGVAVQGYAIDLGEYEAGLHCVAAPVHDESSRLVAAISVSGPSFRMGEGVLEREVVDAVTRHAYELSQQLGYPG